LAGSIIEVWTWRLDMPGRWKAVLGVGAAIALAGTAVAAINTAPPAQDTAITVYKTPT